MFGVAPVRTRSEQMELAHSGLPPRSYNDQGAESALLRTRALLEGTINQQQHVMSSVRLPSDLKADELAALSVLRSVLIGLESCILEHDNPPPTVSKRKVLIKVEKARREVLAAVRECGCRVVESQKLFEEVERFIELRPDEVVSPRSLNIKWNRQAPARPAPQQRDQAFGRNFRPGDSLIASIVGLSAIAEGRERDTPTADVGGPTAAFGPCQPTDKPQPHDALLRPHGSTTLPGSERDYATAAQQPLGVLRDGAEARATDGVDGGGVSRPVNNAAAVVQAQTTVQAAKEAALAMRKLQLQPRMADSLDGGDDDLRPSLSHDIVPSSATTMCNMDSCVSGPNRGPTGEAGADAANRRSYACDGDDEDDDDEVNSAEGRCYEAGSPGHRVSLLGQRGPSAAARAAALVQSTAATALTRPADVAAAPQAAAAESLASLAVQGGGGLDGAAVVAAGCATAAVKPAATATSPAPRSAKAMEAARGSLESINADRSYIGAEPRRRHSGVNAGPAPPPPAPPSNPLPPQHPQPHPQHPHAHLAQRTGVNAPLVGALDILTDGNQVAAADLDAIGLIAAAAAHQQHPPPQHQPIGPPPRYATNRHQPAVPAAGVAAAAVYHHAVSQAQAAAYLPPQAHPHPHPAVGVHNQLSVYPHALYPPQPPQGYQHPALAAAVAAAAAHPYNANGFPHPYLGPLNGAGGVYSLPPSVPSSLRDFPIAGPPTRPGTAGGAAAAPAGPGRYGSQPPSGHHSLDSGQYPASATPWDNVSLADTEPLPGAGAGNGRRGRRGGRRKGGGLFGLVRNVVGFVGVSMLSGAAMVLGAAAVNTGLDEQEASQQARQRHGAQQGGARRAQRLGRGGDDLIPQRTLQQLRSPDLLALGRG